MIEASSQPFPQAALAPRGGAKRISLRFAAAVIGVYLIVILVAGAFMLFDPPTRTIAWPVAVTLFSVGVLFVGIRWRDRSPSYFEIGLVSAGILTLYAAYPPVYTALTRFQFSPDRDNRFASGQPTPAQYASIAWWYAIYVAAFCAAYFLARPRHSTRREPIRLPGRAVPLAAAILLLAAKLFEVSLTWSFGLHPETYGEEYVVIRELPVFWRQMANIVDGMQISLQIIILAALFCYYRRTKWIIVLFVVTLVCLTIFHRGQRTEMAIVVIAAMQLRDLLVRRIPAKAIVAAATVGFLLFMVMAVVRQERSEGFRLPTAEELTATGTDFEGIFDNAYDLKYLLNASGAFRGHPSLLFADLIGLVPQQFVPFPKASASIWYVATYYPAVFAQGGGLVFGVVSEAIVGYGPIELVLRGVFIGIMLALVQRWYVRGRVGVIFLSFYVWMTIMSYLTYRNTTLAIFSQTLYRFVPAAVATLLLAAALRRGRQLRGELLASRR